MGQKAPVVRVYSADASVTCTAAGAPEGQQVNLSVEAYVASAIAAAVGTLPVAAVLSANSTANGADNATLTADAGMTLTFAAVGRYALEVQMFVSEATSGAGGFQFDLNSGTATVTDFQAAVTGFAAAAIANTAAITSVASATSLAAVSTSASAPSWVLLKGQVNITVAGTLALRWAQEAASANGTILQTGSYIKATPL